ncbi:HK97 gp10 family phage protein [Escherichia coli]
MGVKIRGLDQVKQRLNALVGEVQGRKVGRAIKSAMFLIGSDAATMTPVSKTAVLINSQYQEIRINGSLITGRIGYSANYAVYVHEASGRLKGQPRANGHGNYWDPAAEPNFLRKALEQNRQKAIETIRRELRL